MMLGDTEVRSIDAWRGSFFRNHASISLIRDGSSTARYRAASSGGEISARRLKYALVVSFSRTGGAHAATLVTACDTLTTALVSSGTDPCPAGPLATNSIAYGIFS